ncbi:MAG TPA: ATP-binding protein [Candidatus Ozemobacteraceae bacterium]|nr:ATP-binding protein [Candidatus Ozemobacteraceae bacterium]
MGTMLINCDDTQAGVRFLALRCMRHCIATHHALFDKEAIEKIFAFLPKPELVSLLTRLHPKLRRVGKRWISHGLYQYAFLEPPVPDDVARAVAELEPVHALYIPEILAVIDRLLADIAPDGETPNSAPFPQLAEITRVFRLSEDESAILAFCFINGIHSPFNEVIQKLGGFLNFGLSGNLVSLFHPIPRARADAICSSGGLLRRLGFINENLVPTPEICEFLQGFRTRPLNDMYYTMYDERPVPADRLVMRTEDIETIGTLVANRRPGEGLDILFSGPAGTGKTESARSLATFFGLRLFEIRARCDTQENVAEVPFRMRALRACRNALAGRADAAILIDEADAMVATPLAAFDLTPGTAGKAVINETLDTAADIQIWIVNHAETLDPSVRRRFAHAVRFERASARMRRMIWETARARYGMTRLLDDAAIADLAERYETDAGGIDSALRHTRHLSGNGVAPGEVLAQIERLLAGQARFTPGESGHGPAGFDREPTVGIEHLNIEPRADLDMIVHAIAGVSGEDRLPALRILLQGPPGTGKSRFAAELARRIGRPLRVKTAAAILSPFVGLAERAVHEAFREAASEGAVLFFDEIDSLLFTRDRASASWDVSRVNELLSAMDSHPGIFLAATNHLQAIDPAALRRFEFRLDFGPLDGNDAKAFYETLLAPLAGVETPEQVHRRFASLPRLTPADFTRVRRRFTLRTASRPDHAALIGALEAGCTRDQWKGARS